MEINNSIIDNNSKTYIIAELSGNHNGDLNLALKTIEAMKKSGANAVKLQTFTPESMSLDSEKSWFQTRKDSLWAGRKLFDLYAEAQTPWEWHSIIQKHANKIGLDFFSSPFDISAVEKLETLNVPAYKIASFEITDIPLIERVAKTKKPIIISTGIAEEEDIVLAVETCRKQGNNLIALLKCTSAYPAPYNEINLKAIPLLEKKFNVIAGLSDHTLGIEIPIAAVVLGAKIIEKHFILDKSIDSVDRDFSLDAHEFLQMTNAIRNVEKALGKASLKLTEKALSARGSARSLFATQDIRKGEIFTDKNIKSLRPGLGLHPKYLPEILGKTSTKDIAKGSPLEAGVFND